MPQRWLSGLTLQSEDANSPQPQGALAGVRLTLSAFVFTWIFYATLAPLVQMFWAAAPLPASPVAALDPFRIANQYGLFAVMTPHRYEVEFQGSNDGQTWTAYPFRYKPQAPPKRRASTRPTSRGLTGTCGSPRSAPRSSLRL